MNNYLFLIALKHDDKELADYFAGFNYQLLRFKTAIELASEKREPIALIMHYSCIKDLKILNELYNKYTVPLIIISDESQVENCIAALENGADDFITKPFNPRELHARINAIRRRVQILSNNLKSEKEILCFQNWQLYPASRQIFGKDKQELLLSAGEYDLLITFLRNPQEILKREFLSQIIKQESILPINRRIDVQISRLRQKIEQDAKHPVLIKTIRNEGYLFTATVLSVWE